MYLSNRFAPENKDVTIPTYWELGIPPSIRNVI